MGIEELINIMDVIVTIYRSKDNMNEEISMWRKRFLDSLTDSKFNLSTIECFMCMPTDNFMKQTPEELIKLLQNANTEEN